MKMSGVGESWNTAKQWSGEQIGVLLAGLQDTDLLRWLDSITNASANAYDKAMDKLYLETHVGGANHRLFDDGHTLSAAWERVKDALPDDSTRQELAGYFGGVWKDMTTAKGLPFVTLRPEQYSDLASSIQQRVPGLPREWIYDALSFDALELVSAGVGAVAWIFMLKEDDKAKLWELIGSMSIVAIMGANPLLGLAAIAAAAYSMIRDTKAKVLPISLGKGAITAGIGSALFLLMGFPFLVELVIVITVLTILRKHNHVGKDAIKKVLPWVKQKIWDLQGAMKGKGSTSGDQSYDTLPVQT